MAQPPARRSIPNVVERRVAGWVDRPPDLSGRSRALLGSLVVVLLALHGFWPGFFLVDSYTLGLIGVLLLLALRPLLKSANVAGVAGVEFRDELEAGEANALQIEAKIEERAPAPDRPGIEDVHALFTIPDYLRELAERDPNVALTGLRIELERALRLAHEVLVDREEGTRRRPASLIAIVRDLEKRGHLDPDQAGLAQSIVRVGNRAAHGELVTGDEAELVFEWADTLNRSFAVGYSLNFAPNLDFEEQGLACEYEHCIEHMPLTGGEDACPLWGHDCPGGRRRVVTCPTAQARAAGVMPLPEQRFVSGAGPADLDDEPGEDTA